MYRMQKNFINKKSKNNSISNYNKFNKIDYIILINSQENYLTRILNKNIYIFKKFKLFLILEKCINKKCLYILKKNKEKFYNFLLKFK